MNTKFNFSDRFTGYSKLVKSIMDRLIAAIALLFFSPILLMIAIAIYIRMGHPILFTQPRPGKDGRIFTFYKFRTMTYECDSDGNLLPEEKRLIAVGKFLRQTSLDELPQLWNVIKGDMSLVGPRPLLQEYLPYYSDKEMKRHNMRPGVTGLAQISGRNELPWNERLALDVYYIENWSLLLDAKVLFKTIYKVLLREAVTVIPNVTMKDLNVERQYNKN